MKNNNKFLFGICFLVQTTNRKITISSVEFSNSFIDAFKKHDFVGDKISGKGERVFLPAWVMQHFNYNINIMFNDTAFVKKFICNLLTVKHTCKEINLLGIQDFADLTKKLRREANITKVPKIDFQYLIKQK